jgi:threonine/homoserine/homoserine lactone efflux protein
MTAEHAIAFFAFAFVAAITPGPSNVMLTATGAAAGIRGGLPCLLGVLVGMGLLIFAFALGLGQLVLAHGFVLTLMNGLGAAFLLWLAWKIATSRPGGDGGGGKPAGFFEALAFQWVNPKSWLVSASAVGTYLQAGADAVLPQAMLFAALFLAAALPSGLVWLAFGATMQRLLKTPRAARVFNLVMAASLAASIAFIIW